MAVHHTTDHEKIRTWVEEYGGEPALTKDEINPEVGEIPTIIFDPDHEKGRIISWEEFFDIFETYRLRFRFDDAMPKEEARWAWGMMSREESLDTSNETSLPEDLDYVEENMFPSAPNSS